MHDSQSTTAGGIGFTSLLALAFIVLKLCGVLNWSWWWILSPIWISVLLFILIFTVILFIAAMSDRKEHKRNKQKNNR